MCRNLKMWVQEFHLRVLRNPFTPWLAPEPSCSFLGSCSSRRRVSDDASSPRTVDNFTNGLVDMEPIGACTAHTHPFDVHSVGVVFDDWQPHPDCSHCKHRILPIWIVLAARRVAISPGHAMLGLTILLMSRAFVDYSTSGLETPSPTHSWHWGCGGASVTRQARNGIYSITFIAGLAVFNRLDSGAFFARIADLLVENARPDSKHWLGAHGIEPILLWEVFALLYYGFLFPTPPMQSWVQVFPRARLFKAFCTMQRPSRQIRSPSLPSPAV